MFERDGYFMQRFAEVGEEYDLACFGRTRSRKPCHRLVRTISVGTQKQRHLKGCVKTEPNPLIGFLMVN